MHTNKQQRKRTPLDTVKLIVSKMGFDYAYLSDIIASYEEYLKSILPDTSPERIDKYYEIQAKSKYILTYQGMFKDWLVTHKEWLRSDVLEPTILHNGGPQGFPKQYKDFFDKAQETNPLPEQDADTEGRKELPDRKRVMSQLKKVLLDNGYYVGSSEAADILRTLADVWDD